MKPPALALALVAAAAPTSEFEIVAGDLHEEYLRIMHLRGAKAANRWYWAQTLLSLPSLLSYSRSKRSVPRRIGVALIALAVLAAMVLVTMAIETVSEVLFGGHGLPDYVFLSVLYLNVVVFGAILAWLVRTDGLRVTFLAALFLVLCFVIPALAGHPGSQAPLASWIVLFGAIPAMCIGAALYQAVSRGMR